MPIRIHQQNPAELEAFRERAVVEADPEWLCARDSMGRRKPIQFRDWPAGLAKRDHSGIRRLTKQSARNMVRRDGDQRKFE
ncbi:hypothetical protein XH87_00125 [Bradyrhizobium sp. CCBAU 53415]|nr:hypothetical protein [Bradyrhizobium sp. CCBAU 53415]